MKASLFFGVVFCLSLPLAVFTEDMESEDFKIKFSIPEGTEFKKYQDGKWGGFLGKDEESDTEVYALCYKGETDRDEIYQYGEKVSKVPEKRWKEDGKGKDENGFAWWEAWAASESGKTLYALMGKNAEHDIYYLFFIYAPDKSFKKYEKDYLAWIESIQAQK